MENQTQSENDPSGDLGAMAMQGAPGVAAGQTETNESFGEMKPEPKAIDTDAGGGEPLVMTSPVTGEASEPPQEKSKSKKPLLILSIILLLMCIAGAGVAIYFKVRNDNQFGISGEQPAQAKDLTPLTPTTSLRLSGNSLADFDLAFLKKTNGEKNIIYSPLSIKYALAMLADAAEGESKDQITGIIGDYKPAAYLNSENRSIANALMVRTDFAEAVKQSYVGTLSNKYNASLITDSFETPDNANKWVSEGTLGIINDLFDESTLNENTAFMLVNALAIDMKWTNQLQCEAKKGASRDVPCKNAYGWYSVSYPHESHSHDVSDLAFGKFEKMNFADSGEIDAARIGADANRYDIITELGEDYIRKTVLDKYEEWLAALPEDSDEERDFDIEEYMSELGSNYGNIGGSTDFYYYATDDEKVFAKDLQEYDDETLQYVGIMPQTESLQNYINSMTAEKASGLIGNLKDAANLDDYEDGVVTSIEGFVPFFKYDYNMTGLMDYLKELGVENVFDGQKSDLSGAFNTTDVVRPYIDTTVHVANIDFSNNGITAAAVTGMSGRGAAQGGFDYIWDVPVKKIDMTFDKPFMYLIRNKRTGEVWFMGAVYNI